MKTIDYEQKYKELRALFIKSARAYWNMGFEEGAKQAQMQAMQEQAQMQAQQMQAQQQQMDQMQLQQQQQSGDAAAAAAGGAAGEGDMAGQQPEAQDDVGQAIGELEGIVNKSDLSVDDLKKATDLLKSVHSISFLANTSPNTKRELSTQEKIVDGIFKSWEEEEKASANEISRVLEQYKVKEAADKKRE